MTSRLEVALAGGDTARMVRLLLDCGVWGPAPVPRQLVVDVDKTEPTEDWFERHVLTKQSLFVYFDADRQLYVKVDPGGETVRAAFDMSPDGDAVASLLSDLPFEVASFAPLYPEWSERGSAYRSTVGFGDYHFSHGWACAFRRNGHQRLVSRRWLEHGPWQLFRGANDTTLVQFHDPGLDAAEAFAQAEPAHRRMGINGKGGYLQTNYFYKHSLRGFYDAERRVQEVVVIGRELPAAELRDAAAARHRQALGPDKPLDNVAFVLLDPEEARQQLPRLWLYGLECWTIIDEVKTRLDTEEPPPGVDEVAW
ncbi:hypothetical protein [Streptomyces niveus]|uniref:hypothetical protein n=1 Tax=Streptomyces niveus TaxID=193462 RepID=UPI003436923A